VRWHVTRDCHGLPGRKSGGDGSNGWRAFPVVPARGEGEDSSDGGTDQFVLDGPGLGMERELPSVDGFHAGPVRHPDHGDAGEACVGHGVGRPLRVLVQCRRRLFQEQPVRPIGDDPREADPLLFAADTANAQLASLIQARDQMRQPRANEGLLEGVPRASSPVARRLENRALIGGDQVAMRDDPK
jgi:hypothetical protein